ncbi:MAG: chorismate synthase [Clostridiales bacterium]|jgi:chorismate synthase|nr:chorismate synthase [Clostridiales bacterium]
MEYNEPRLFVGGASHTEGIDIFIEGLPDTDIDLAALQAHCDRRRAQRGDVYATARAEADTLVLREKTPHSIRFFVANTAQRSGDYEATRHIPRPSHADYPAYVRSGGAEDLRGGGRWSGRMTLGITAAGGIAKQLLTARGIEVFAHVTAIGNVTVPRFEGDTRDICAFAAIAGSAFPVLDDGAKRDMLAAIAAAKAEGDSLGGIVEVVAFGLPAGAGGALDEGLESAIAAALFAVPAVKGVEFGDGFALAAMKGSEANDGYRYENGRVVTTSNRSGGLVGGMTTGMPLVVRAAVKPTPSIAKPQNSVNLSTRENVTLAIKGRHDACIVPRAAAAIESAVAWSLLKKLSDPTTR